VYLHLVEEAVQYRRNGPSELFVCSACEGSFGQPVRGSPRAPPSCSMAAYDYGRRYLSQSAARSLATKCLQAGVALPPLLARLSPALWRLPVATALETQLLSSSYLHLFSVKVALTGAREEQHASSGSHAVASSHTMYFPLSLLSDNRRRVCTPWRNLNDAKDALFLAVRKVPLIFVGPDDRFDRLKRAALEAAQMQVRPKVVYTLIQLRRLVARIAEQLAPDTVGDLPVWEPFEVEELESVLTSAVISGAIRREDVWRAPSAPDDAGTNCADVAGVRSDCGGAGAVTEGDSVAGCLDTGEGPGDVISAVCRLLRRGAGPLDDYNGQPAALLEAHFPLFPLGEGLPLGAKLSRERSRHLMLFYDCRFATDLGLVFSLADTTVRHLVNSKVSLLARKAPAALAKIEALIKDPTVDERLRRACLDPHGAEAIELLKQVLPFVNMSARSVPYTDARRRAFKGSIMAHQRCMGPSSRASLPRLHCTVVD
jgi:hypothetical protein